MRIRSQQVVVAGIDGSPASVTAARWAAQQAYHRRQTLHVMHAFRATPSVFAGRDYASDTSALVRAEGALMLAEVSAELRARVPGVQIRMTLARADPRLSLVEASAGARLTVLGRHRRGSRREHLGSVASHVAAHGCSPVAVLPEDPVRSDGPILLGVDGSAGCHAALGYAFDEAAVRGADLFALHAREVTGQGLGRRPVLDAAEGREEHAVLAEQLAGWQEKYPDVTVRQYVVPGRPGPALLGYARHPSVHPQMIVIGGHGRGGLAGFLLGSTGHTLISQAPCPVVLARPDPPG
jgi:nucleotide-binding universal stress UspA family protein